ncbi:PTS sugar transporter subunit IIA [Lactobacillus hominis]|nr:PTS sugar transporter subunit IIA [Lactobacillus hominis]
MNSTTRKESTRMSIDKKKLFNKKAVFVTDKTDRNEIFRDVYQELLDLGYVKGDFIQNIIEREDKYPTGISTRPLSHDLPNVAIPHTEGKFVNKQMIVPIALKQPVKFNNMVNPTETLEVKFLFMILNDNPDLHSNILANIMDFLAQTDVEDLNDLFNETDPEQIYDFLETNF